MDTERGSEIADESALRKRKRSEERHHDQTLVQAVDQEEVLPQHYAVEEHNIQEPTVTTKKQRLGTPAATRSDAIQDGSWLEHATILPPEILQHVFSFVDPYSLARLMAVCQAFSVLIDPSRTLPASRTAFQRVGLRDQNDLWALSRRAFAQYAPRPMNSMNELRSWQLVRGHNCQFCGKKPVPKIESLPTAPWNLGPGSDGVRSIWPFQVRSCGSCLEARLVKVCADFRLQPFD